MRIAFLNVLFYIFLISTIITLDAQDASEIRCAFHQNQMDGNIDILAFEDWMDKKRNKTIQNILEKTDGDVMKIPVVFHILHYGEDQGVSTNISK